MQTITRNTRLTFGKHKGTKLCQVPQGYVEWMAETLMDSDLTLWAQAAKRELVERKKESYDIKHRQRLEDQADEILRKAGYRP
ncbi:MAG: hypothetical protein GVY16_00160 [Planctomycetes bacterium]|jgi:hypothetical protein|nr:DUF3820 family protein [Phycisphaerae bacterium]NBB94137.1 hypothetical protein [Planctomycetota bacterium]